MNRRVCLRWARRVTFQLAQAFWGEQNTTIRSDFLPYKATRIDQLQPWQNKYSALPVWNSNMATMSSGQMLQQRLVENSTLLQALCKIPEVPKENQIYHSHDEGRQLSWDRERQLADVFAFISAWTDDSARVMAVCVEENPGKTGMTICLASNSGDLSHVMQGFNDIARTLEQASLRSKAGRIQRARS